MITELNWSKNRDAQNQTELKWTLLSSTAQHYCPGVNNTYCKYSTLHC